MCQYSAMLLLDGGLALVIVASWLFCIFDVLTTDASRCRNLPKPVWILIVLLLFDIGAIAWLVAGRPWTGSVRNGMPYKGNTGAKYPEYDRPGRFAASNPDDDDAFLAQVRNRAEEQRRQYEQRRQAELQAEQDELRRRSTEG
jgi:hypothetical protein